MRASILIALLLSVTTVNADSPSSLKPGTLKPETLNFSVGAMSFTGDSVQLTKSDKTSFKCDVEGQAILTFGDPADADITLAASKMTILRNADSSVTVRCVNDCKFTDADQNVLTADQINVRFTERMEIEMSGHVRITYSVGDNQTTLTGDSVVIRDGVFNISGTASLKLGP